MTPTPTSSSSPLLTPDQSAQMLGIAAGTLSVWRCTRRVDLPYVKVGRAIRYRLSDLETFIAERTVSAK